jgi:hypothetical protein
MDDLPRAAGRGPRSSILSADRRSESAIGASLRWDATIVRSPSVTVTGRTRAWLLLLICKVG